MDDDQRFADRVDNPTDRLVVSGRAAQWIDGLLDSGIYFSIARRQAQEAARREVVARLQRTLRWTDLPSPNRTDGS